MRYAPLLSMGIALLSSTSVLAKSVTTTHYNPHTGASVSTTKGDGILKQAIGAGAIAGAATLSIHGATDLYHHFVGDSNNHQQQPGVGAGGGGNVGTATGVGQQPGTAMYANNAMGAIFAPPGYRIVSCMSNGTPQLEALPGYAGGGYGQSPAYPQPGTYNPGAYPNNQPPTYPPANPGGGYPPTYPSRPYKRSVDEGKGQRPASLDKHELP